MWHSKDSEIGILQMIDIQCLAINARGLNGNRLDFAVVYNA